MTFWEQPPSTWTMFTLGRTLLEALRSSAKVSSLVRSKFPSNSNLMQLLLQVQLVLHQYLAKVEMLSSVGKLNGDSLVLKEVLDNLSGVSLNGDNLDLKEDSYNHSGDLVHKATMGNLNGDPKEDSDSPSGDPAHKEASADLSSILKEATANGILSQELELRVDNQVLGDSQPPLQLRMAPLPQAARQLLPNNAAN